MQTLGSPSSPGASSGAAPSATPAKKVKAASVLDQLDESEIPLLSQAQLDEAYRFHAEITGADPPADAEPTGEQIAALRARVADRGESPYADFSVLTPFGRRVQKQMKARSWMACSVFENPPPRTFVESSPSSLPFVTR